MPQVIGLPYTYADSVFSYGGAVMLLNLTGTPEGNADYDAFDCEAYAFPDGDTPPEGYGDAMQNPPARLVYARAPVKCGGEVCAPPPPPPPNNAVPIPTTAMRLRVRKPNTEVLIDARRMHLLNPEFGPVYVLDDAPTSRALFAQLRELVGEEQSIPRIFHLYRVVAGPADHHFVQKILAIPVPDAVLMQPPDVPDEDDAIPRPPLAPPILDPLPMPEME